METFMSLAILQFDIPTAAISHGDHVEHFCLPSRPAPIECGSHHPLHILSHMRQDLALRTR